MLTTGAEARALSTGDACWQTWYSNAVRFTRKPPETPMQVIDLTEIQAKIAAQQAVSAPTSPERGRSGLQPGWSKHCGT